MANLVGDSNDPDVPAVFGDHTAGAAAILGHSNKGRGVFGISNGVFGIDHGSAGVFGECKANIGVKGVAETGTGVNGVSKSGFGVAGEAETQSGVIGISNTGRGVEGRSNTGPAIYGKGGRVAGFFEGNVEVTGDIRLINADCAEDFDICETVQSEPGTVMILGAEGVLHPSQHGYDKRVAGVISGAGDYKPGIVLDKHDSQPNRKPIALLGKVYCKADASYAPIEVGDLLTTSPNPGHAMKATDQLKAFGAVIGKALRPLHEGQGLLPILIALQ